METRKRSRIKLHLFDGYGVELEYMIVDGRTLAVKPVCDEVMFAVNNSYLPEVEFGAIAWSNELALHVIELKTNGPVSSMLDLADGFHDNVRRINDILSRFNAKLLPTGAHPFMDPKTDSRLWPHEYNQIYHAYSRIFDCRGHGWMNLQSAHLNLAFSGDEEFARLHAALRMVMPIIPALCASTPIIDGRRTSFLDSRLQLYRKNQKLVPSIAGKVIPERVWSEADYKRHILREIYDDIAPYDPKGILQHEWLNSRGSIARFERSTIELRVVDLQETPDADIAVLTAIVAAVKGLVDERWSPLSRQQQWSENRLARILSKTIRDADHAVLTDKDYLEMFGYPSASPCTALDLWKHIVSDRLPEFSDQNPALSKCLQIIFEHGVLARRIRAAVGPRLTKTRLTDVYHRLADCLTARQMFVPD